MTDQTAVWIDGDPLMEAIAADVWEQCRTEGTSLVVDDLRNIAAVAAAVARAHAASPAPATDQAALRDRIAAELARADGWDWAGANFSALQTPTADRYRRLAAAALAVLPAPADRATTCICGHTEAQHFEDACLVCDCGDYLPPAAARELILRHVAAAARDSDTPAEDPARIDRIRPEFTEHSSVEAIDAQLRRARSQQRRWHLRAEWLISLRQRRVDQKARGEWPAASDAAVEQPKEARL